MKWSYVCGDCATKLKISKAQLDDSGQGFCMVKGCDNTTETDYSSNYCSYNQVETFYYIDFKDNDPLTKHFDDVVGG